MARSGGGSTPAGAFMHPSAMSVDPIAGGILYGRGPRTEYERRIQERKGSQLCSMFCILTVVLIWGPRGPSDDPQSTVGSSCEPDIWTTSYEVIMARIGALMERPLADRRKSQEAGNDQGRNAPPNGDALMERILGNMNVTAQEEVLKRIASLPRTRRDKVLDIRSQIAEGTYEVADRLERTVDRILEAITA